SVSPTLANAHRSAGLPSGRCANRRPYHVVSASSTAKHVPSTKHAPGLSQGLLASTVAAPTRAVSTLADLTVSGGASTFAMPSILPSHAVNHDHPHNPSAHSSRTFSNR